MDSKNQTQKREIKFRAFDGNKVIDLHLDDWTFFNGTLCHRNAELYPVMEFINSKDRDGNDVYEGDILEAPSGNRFLVKWYDDEMRWAMYTDNTWYNMNMALHKVVGNIYETPELLK